MAKFCAKCGSQLDDDAMFCNICGAQCEAFSTPQNESLFSPPSDTVSETPFQPDFYNNSNPEFLPPAPKKSKQKRILSIVCVILAAALALTTVFVILPMFNKNSGPGYIVAGKDEIAFNTSYGTYYHSGLDFINTDTIPTQFDELGIDDHMHHYSQAVVVGDEVYYSTGYEKIVKVTFEQSTDPEIDAKVVPVSNDWLTLDDLSYLDENLAQSTIKAGHDWQYYDGYIYFYCVPSTSYDMLHNTFYRFGKININNKSVEFFGDNINVCSYVICDGWVYFSDNGCTRNNNILTFQQENAGLYKMKLDGSQKTKLLNLNCPDNEAYLREGEGAYSNLSIYNGKLYFIDNTDVYNSILHRCNLDGSAVEKVASRGTYDYTFDASTNKLYYVTASYTRTTDEVKEIYEVSLKNNFSEKKILDYALNSDRIRIKCLDSKLYIMSWSKLFGNKNFGSKDDPSLIGIYFDLKKNKATAAYRYAIMGTKVSTFMGMEFIQEEIVDIEYYWQEYTGEDELFTFYN